MEQIIMYIHRIPFTCTHEDTPMQHTPPPHTRTTNMLACIGHDEDYCYYPPRQ